MIFQGIRTSIAKKPYILGFFRRSLDPLSPPPLWICPWVDRWGPDMVFHMAFPKMNGLFSVIQVLILFISSTFLNVNVYYANSFPFKYTVQYNLCFHSKCICVYFSFIFLQINIQLVLSSLTIYWIINILHCHRGSLQECSIWDWGVPGSSLKGDTNMSLSKIIYSHYFVLVQSRKMFEHDWKMFGNLIFQIFAVKTLCSRNWHVTMRDLVCFRSYWKFKLKNAPPINQTVRLV